jgi:hypothetical protein
MSKATPSAEESFVKPASSSEIMQALTPCLTSGPSGLAVRISTNEITLRREQRKFSAPRNVAIDTLVDEAVNMSGPLTEDEATLIYEPYKEKGITMKIQGDTAYFTRKAHTAKIATNDGKVKGVSMRDRTVSSSLDVPMAHITQVLNELLQGGEVFE